MGIHDELAKLAERAKDVEARAEARANVLRRRARDQEGRARRARGAGESGGSRGPGPVRDDLAYSAVIEAEYAALDAHVARMEADEVTADASSPA